MTGPEHYAEAERLLSEAVTLMERQMPAIKTLQHEQVVLQAGSAAVALAQVHATLALTAAQALAAVGGRDAEPDLCRKWRTAVGA